jgi:hypothetical protein
MKFSEEQIQDIVSLKDNLIDQIDKHHKAIKTLEKNLTILDLVLKESSFTKASDLRKNKIKVQDSIEKKPVENPIPIKRGSSDEVIANAFVTRDQVSIILDENMEIDADIPPFKSFFINRIIGEMKRKDSADAENGKIQKESMIDYIINKNGSDIREIIIKNYRQKERINEIINTAGWSLTRMLENIKR